MTKVMNLTTIKEHLDSWPEGSPEHPDTSFDVYEALGWLIDTFEGVVAAAQSVVIAHDAFEAYPRIQRLAKRLEQIK